MRRALLLGFLGLVTAQALASPELVPIKGIRHASWDHTTGQWVPGDGGLRSGDPIWAANQLSGYYFPSTALPSSTVGEREWLVLDWGDIAGPVRIGAIRIGYGASYNTYYGAPSDCLMLFYANENGHDSSDRTCVAGFIIEDLPYGYDASAWRLTISLDDTGSAFTIDGDDLDGDGLIDFGYSYLWELESLMATNGDMVGPLIAGDPNASPPTAPGIEDAYDVFEQHPVDPNRFTYLETQSFSEYGPDAPFSQFYMELFASEHCPYPGASGSFCSADIADGDCIVALSDLAQLLANYGVMTGATHDMGDVEPDDGDGDVDLQDLATLLAQYGDDCIQPPP